MGEHPRKWGRGAGAFLLGCEQRARVGLNAVKRAYRAGTLPGPEAYDLLILWATCPTDQLEDWELDYVVWARRQLPYFMLKPGPAKCRPAAVADLEKEGC